MPKFDYFYGNEDIGNSEDNILIPLFLLRDEPFRNLSDSSKLAYSIMLRNYGKDLESLNEKLNNSLKISRKYFTKAKEMLNLPEHKVKKVIDELSKVDLLEE